MAFLKYLIGPELIWIIACLVAKAVKKSQMAQAGQLNKWIEHYALFLPLVMIALTMLLYAFPMVHRKFLLLRIIIVAIIGTNFLLEPILSAHTEGGPGIGTVYIVAYGLVFVAIPVVIIGKVFFIK